VSLARPLKHRRPAARATTAPPVQGLQLRARLARTAILPRRRWQRAVGSARLATRARWAQTPPRSCRAAWGTTASLGQPRRARVRQAHGEGRPRHSRHQLAAVPVTALRAGSVGAAACHSGAPSAPRAHSAPASPRHPRRAAHRATGVQQGPPPKPPRSAVQGILALAEQARLRPRRARVSARAVPAATVHLGALCLPGVYVRWAPIASAAARRRHPARPRVHGALPDPPARAQRCVLRAPTARRRAP
jgi:hypothetical protein